jgi:hypothetical protein
MTPDPCRERPTPRISPTRFAGLAIDFGLSHRVPLISGWPVFARAGAICTYGPRLTSSYRRMAYYVDRILKGTLRRFRGASGRNADIAEPSPMTPKAGVSPPAWTT